MFLVVLEDLGIYENVIQVANGELVEIGSNGMVADRLRCRRCISQPEGHKEVLVVSIGCAKCCLPFVAIVDAIVGVGNW